MTTLTAAQLIEEHNALADQLSLDHLTSWKKSKDLLVAQIEDLKQQLKDKEPEQTKMDLPEIELPSPENPDGTIREYSLQLLCAAHYYEDRTRNPSPTNRVEADHPDARSVGFAYKLIVDKVKSEFPHANKGEGAKTTAACLRWYAVKVRNDEFGFEDYRLAQRRPRK